MLKRNLASKMFQTHPLQLLSNGYPKALSTLQKKNMTEISILKVK